MAPRKRAKKTEEKAGVRDLVSLTGKHLPDPSAAGQRVSRAALDLLRQAFPDELVRDVVSVSAPVARLGGRTHAGAAALASTLKVLAQPPGARRPVKSEMTLDELGERVGRSRTVLTRWANEGLLGDPVTKQRGRKWGPDGLQRARLVDYLVRRGVKMEEILEANRGNRLSVLVLSQTLAGRATLTRDEVARAAGVPLGMIDELTAALGVAAGEADEPLYSEKEVQAIRLLGALRSVYSDDDLVEVASVVGRAMHEVAEAALELFRRRFARPFAEAGAGELEMMLRLATVIDLTVPTTGPMLELVLRRQLEVTGRAEAVMQLESAAGGIDGQLELAVGFADIVGFTAASSRMNALEVSQLAARLLRTSEKVFTPHGARLVKTIGDAVMFTAGEEAAGIAAAGDLLRAWRQEDGVPPLRVGLAYGPMLRAYADYFGRTVNVASRLCDAAPADTIYLMRRPRGVRAPTFKNLRLKAADAGEKALRGINGPVPVIELRPAETASRRRPRAGG